MNKCCCMCYETKGVYSIKEMLLDKKSPKFIINQCKILLDLGHIEEDYFCEECFWK